MNDDRTVASPFVRLWPWIVPALLVGQLAIAGVTVYLALADPSFASEPDYYRKALHWNETAAERRAEHELGWGLQVEVSELESLLHERTIHVALHDREGAPVENADVTAEAFHHARAGDRKALRFVAAAPGSYEAPLTVRRSGLWELRFRVRVGDRGMATTRVLDIGPAGGVRP